MLYPECDSNTSFRSWTKIAVSIVIAIAMITIALFSLSGCGGASAGSSSSGSPSSNTPEPAPVKTVDDYTWEELSEISAEISNETTEEGAIEIAKKYNLVNSDGKLDGTQTKTVQLTAGVSATVQIAGFLHDDKTGGGKAGITFIFQDVIAEHDMNPSLVQGPSYSDQQLNSGGWKESSMRSWLSATVIPKLPQDLADRIVAVDKKTNNTGLAHATSASVTTTSDQLWLFSVKELFGDVDVYDDAATQTINCEGSQYKLFRDCDVIRTDEIRSFSILSKIFKGSPSEWWTRSPMPDDSMEFEGISEAGGLIHSDACAIYGVVPGFCI